MMLARKTLIKQNKDIVAKTIDGQIFLFNNISGNLYSMNDTAGEIWNQLATPTPIGELIKHQLDTFNTKPQIAEKDTMKLIEQLIKLGFALIV